MPFISVRFSIISFAWQGKGARGVRELTARALLLDDAFQDEVQNLATHLPDEH